MTALQIRNVPDDVRDTLAQRARARGQSLQAFLLALVEDEARRQRNLALLEAMEGRSDGVDSPDAVLQALDAVRAERDARA